MSLPVRFSQLNVSNDGSNWGYLKSVSTTHDLELKAADGSNVIVQNPLYYKDSSDVSTALNATLDSFAASISTFIAKSYVDAADVLLQNNIDAEAASRAADVATLEASDAVLQTNIDTEAASRAAAVATLEAADSALDTRVAAIEDLLTMLGSSSPP